MVDGALNIGDRVTVLVGHYAGRTGRVESVLAGIGLVLVASDGVLDWFFKHNLEPLHELTELEQVLLDG